mgnify:CR=1 FL=1
MRLRRLAALRWPALVVGLVLLAFNLPGLGLALTKAFAEMMGGTIAVESTEGEGTSFTLTLPADVRHPVGSDTATAEPGGEAGSTDRVLVIDDDPHMRDLLTRFLGRDGLTVAAAANGQDGLALAREIAPSAIILDVMMPRMDGWAVLSALKADPDLAEIPVIMVSMIRETGLAYSLGAADYLTKPVDWQRLKETVDRHRLPSATPAGLALVVESDAATREELGHLLAGEGWEVAGAADADAAQARIAEGRPDLILVNLDLPEVGGLATSEVAAVRGGPLVLLYSDDLDDSVERVRAAGGEIVNGPYAFPGGRRFHFTDPSGNELGVWSTS